MRSMALIFLGILAGGTARAETSYQKLLAHVQATYLRDAAPYPILILDRDELEWRFTAAGAVGEKDNAKREGILRDYIREKTGVAITENAASNFEPYLSVLSDAAIAMPALADDGTTIAMCAVFPPDPNRNRRLETLRILQLQTKEAYGEKSFEELRESLSYDDAVLMSVLHESGHCMDRTFFPQMTSGDTDPSTVHQAESFAEAMALFLMVKEGRPDVAATRAYLRDVYSFFMEPFFLAHPELGLGSDTFTYGGLIYHLSPVIRAAKAALDASPGAIEAMPLAQVQQLATDLVNQHAFDNRILSALYLSYTDGHAAALERYKGFEAEMPDLFKGIVAKMQGYWNADAATHANAFQPAPPARPGTKLATFDNLGACVDLAKGNFDGLRDRLETLRQDLRAGNPSVADEAARFDLLSNLWKTLPGACKGGAQSMIVLQKQVKALAFFVDAAVPRKK